MIRFPTGRYSVCATLSASAAIALCVLTSGDTKAKQFKWVDENGVIQFSDLPPRSVPLEQVSGPKQGTVGEELERRKLRRLEEARAVQEIALEQQADADSQTSAVPAQIKVHSRWTCEEARRFHQAFADSDPAAGRFFTANADGSYSRSSPEGLARLAKAWEAAAKTLCQPGVDRLPLPSTASESDPDNQPSDTTLTADEANPDIPSGKDSRAGGSDDISLAPTSNGDSG